MRGSVTTMLIVVVVFVAGFFLLARAADQEFRSQECRLTCTP